MAELYREHRLTSQMLGNWKQQFLAADDGPAALSGPAYVYASEVVETAWMNRNDPHPSATIQFFDLPNLLGAADGLRASILNSTDYGSGANFQNHACVVVRFGGAVTLDDGVVQAYARQNSLGRMAIDVASGSLGCNDTGWTTNKVLVGDPTLNSTAKWHGSLPFDATVRSVRIRFYNNANVLRQQRRLYLDAVRLYGVLSPNTPTPAPTPTPTYAPSTSLDFTGQHTGLKAVIFWAIFNESSSDNFDSGSSVGNFDLGNPRPAVVSLLLSAYVPNFAFCARME